MERLIDSLIVIAVVALAAHHIVLCFLIAARRSLFTRRTFRIYLASTAVNAAIMTVALWALARGDGDGAFVALVFAALLFWLRELYLGRDGREEVTRHRVTLFKFGPWR